MLNGGDNNNIKLVEEEELRREGSRGEKFLWKEEIAEWSDGIAATEIDITEEMRSVVARREKVKANEIIGEMMATKGTGEAEVKEWKEAKSRKESELFSKGEVVTHAEEMKEVMKRAENNKQEVVGWLSKVDPGVRLRLKEQLTEVL